LAAGIAVLAQAFAIPEPPFEIAALPARDWVLEILSSFRPIQVGRFFIHGSHFQERLPAGVWPLTIDAATAFGSGEHASTRGCLLALDRLSRQRSRSRAASFPPAKHRAQRRAERLDMGCGSGILAMAMARIWRQPVAAVDIETEAVRVTRFNARLNRLAALIQAQAGDGYRSSLARGSRRWRLVTANILARPLARMAPALARSLAPGGIAILAGLLARQERLVLAAHRGQKLFLRRRYDLDGWRTLVLQRPNRRRLF
jgi:ribosomal protein L11 methyltransferase